MPERNNAVHGMLNELQYYIWRLFVLVLDNQTTMS